MNSEQTLDCYRKRKWLNALAGLFLCVAGLIHMASARAETDAWNTTDKTLLVAVEASYYLDFRQTREIALNPLRYYETNQLLGRHPSIGRVNNYFLATAIGTYSGFQSICALIASSLCGLLWYHFGSMFTFLLTAGITVVVVVYLIFYKRTTAVIS